MPVDIQENINNFGDKILKNNTIRNILVNPLAYTISITIVIILIIFLFSSDGKVSYIYIGILTFIIILVTSMFSHQALRNDLQTGIGDEQYQNLAEGEYEKSDDHVEMIPRIDNIQF